ncbi:outer membrane protein [Helicobacter cetorum]|nr:outer membrane protein [Helicobacter cetorum]
MGAVMTQSNALLQLISPNQFSNTLIASHYALENNANSEVIKNLESLRKQSFERYLNNYLQNLKATMIKGYILPGSDGGAYSPLMKNSVIMQTIESKIENILANLKSSHSTLNVSTITTDLNAIVTLVQENTIGNPNFKLYDPTTKTYLTAQDMKNKTEQEIEKDIAKNGILHPINGNNSSSKQQNHAYLSPELGIQNLMFFQMLQGIAENKKDVNYAYALYNATDFENSILAYMSSKLYTNCQTDNGNCYYTGGKAQLEVLLEQMNVPKSLIDTYNKMGQPKYFLGNTDNGGLLVSGANLYSLLTQLENEVQDLKVSQANMQNKTKALDIIRQSLADVYLYDEQVKNPSVQFGNWISSVIGSGSDSVLPVSLTIQNEKLIIQGNQGYCGQNHNGCPKLTEMSTQDLYNTIMSWWDNVGNVANALTSHNNQQIGTAIQSFSQFYNEMYSKYPHYQQNTANSDAYPTKAQLQNILNDINNSLNSNKVSQNTIILNFLALPTNSQQHQATYNTLQSSKPIALASLSTLASMFNNMNYLSSPTTKLTNNDKDIESTQQGYMLGFGIKGGYKQMFNYYIKGNRESKKKYGQLGLRYYAFLDYNYGVLNQRNTNKENMNMLTYGVGLDILVNVFENKLASYGIFGGFQVAGNSWLATRKYSSNMKDKIRATHFQCLFDFGLRTNILSHHGIELGVKIPMLSQRYIDTANYKVNYKREFVYYVGYVWGF